MSKRKRLGYAKLLQLANEEAKTARLYKEWGFWRFARDEHKHSMTFRKIAQRMRKRKRR